jgi:hypothetical protein
MSHSSGNRAVISFSLFTVLIIMACSVSMGTPAPAAPAATAFDPTKVALEMQSTAMSMFITQAAMNAQQAAPEQPVVEQPTAAPAAPTAIPAAPTEDIEAKIKNAKVLVYENTDERGIGMWVQDALDSMGMKYTQTGSYSGTFMQNLDSSIKWDLLIVDAEDKDIISGEFWDVINTRLTRDKVAMIAEIWYLDTEANGPIAKILGGCGIRFRTDLPVDESVYWWAPEHPIFNEPNTVMPLLHYYTFWSNQAGDKIMQAAGGDATMLAGLSARQSSGEGVLATCYGGRVVIQTFSDHDYHQADIIPLWQNYIHYTLKNHFEATP